MNFYHKKLRNKDVGVILTSQSGETADTLAAMRKAQKGAFTPFQLLTKQKAL